MSSKVYKGEYASKIEFPLGGIGTGCVSISGTGELVNWEMFSRPNKETRNGYTHFAIKAEDESGVVDARVLQGDITQNFYGTGYGEKHSWGFGHGTPRTSMAGFPHFKDVTFGAKFPYAEINYSDKDFPAKITLDAFNPFIPVNDADSSIPAAFFTWKIYNSSNKRMKYTVAFSCQNPLLENTINKKFSVGGIHGIEMSSTASPEPRFNGTVRISTDADDVAVQEYWYRGAWFDDSTVFWQEFASPEKLPERKYETPAAADMCTLCATVSVEPYETRDVKFLLSWYVPDFVKTWNIKDGEEMPKWKNYYTKLFASHDALLEYVYKNWERLDKYSRLFSNLLLSTTMPDDVRDRVISNLAILKSSTCLRLENGEFYGFEGVNKDVGSCEGSCAHVYNYAYELRFLCSKLERRLPALDYTYNQAEDGGMQFRLMLPLGKSSYNFRPCVDGQMGGILKFYRDFKICGDTEWLKLWWPKVKKSLEYAWSDTNKDKWDPDKSGVIMGRQHHTLDVELFSANSWLSGFYLAALKAASEISRYLGETEDADMYDEIYRKGKEYMERELFNGEYYIQKINIEDKGIIEYGCGADEKGKQFYWDEEIQQAKYQYNDGCLTDQILAQWHASLIGLGDVFDSEHRRKAAESIYRYNFKCMRDVFNPCRLYSVNDERGVRICTWPKGSHKPRIPIPYSEETMCGFEYAAACLMLQNGYERECLEIISALSDRYDGKKRNPFSENECGASYVRSLASYSLLLTYSGFIYDMSKMELGFSPVRYSEGYSSFWSVDGGWGSIRYSGGKWIFSVMYGKIELKRFFLPKIITSVIGKDKILNFKNSCGYAEFDKAVKLTEGDSLIFSTSETD